jgi:hypothetical protein
VPELAPLATEPLGAPLAVPALAPLAEPAPPPAPLFAPAALLPAAAMTPELGEVAPLVDPAFATLPLTPPPAPLCAPVAARLPLAEPLALPVDWPLPLEIVFVVVGPPEQAAPTISAANGPAWSHSLEFILTS